MDYYIGWDVGAWRTGNGDAIWILDSEGNGAYKWSGNLGAVIEESPTIDEFITALFTLSRKPEPAESCRITLAIDAPFSLPEGLRKLLGDECSASVLGAAITNPYLFRKTEQFAARYLGRNPLSAVQDQIGSQTTKTIHFLKKFNLVNNHDGTWRISSSRRPVTAIEAYPAMMKVNRTFIRPPRVNAQYRAVLDELNITTTKDEKDALLCAIVANLHATEITSLHAPRLKSPDFEPEEGWIWFPKIDRPAVLTAEEDSVA